MSPRNLPTQYQLVQVLSLNKSINFNMQSYLKTEQYPTESFYQYDKVLWYSLLNGKSIIELLFLKSLPEKKNKNPSLLLQDFFIIQIRKQTIFKHKSLFIENFAFSHTQLSYTMKCSPLTCRMKFLCMHTDILILIFPVIMYCG